MRIIRDEQYSTAEEIITHPHIKSVNEATSAGPIIYNDEGLFYIDESSSHSLVVGRTGEGKTESVSLPYVGTCIKKKESFIAMDSKGDLYRRTGSIIPKEYKVVALDLGNPRHSKSSFNIIYTIFQMYRSDNPDDKDFACDMIGQFCKGVYPEKNTRDPFWENSAAQLCTGIVHLLFELCISGKISQSALNIDNIYATLQQAEERVGGDRLLKSYYKRLNPNSLAKRNLASYVNAPDETRMSIHCVACQGLGVFCQSRGLMELLAHDTLDMLNLVVSSRPFALYIIIPDESATLSALGAIIVGMLTHFLIRKAREFSDNKLPLRTHVILEELGSCGKSIETLPSLAVACRSRNIKLMMCLQNYEQLKDIYGASQTETILGSVGTHIAFSTSHWPTLKDLSERCGTRHVTVDGHIIERPLLTPSQIYAMSPGMALIMHGSLRYVTRLPMYDQVFPGGSLTQQIDSPSWIHGDIYEATPIDLKGIYEKYYSPHFDLSNFDPMRVKPGCVEPVLASKETTKNGNAPAINACEEDALKKLIDEIDRELAQLNMEESLSAKEKSKKVDRKKYRVWISFPSSAKEDVIKIIADFKHTSKRSLHATFASEDTKEFSYMTEFGRLNTANAFVNAIRKCGGDGRVSFV